MFKRLAIIGLIVATLFAAMTEAKTKKTTAKKSVTKAKGKSSRQFKPAKHSRKSRRFHSRGNGPDLKSITTESPYKEDPSNGVTPVETKQPGL